MRARLRLFLVAVPAALLPPPPPAVAEPVCVVVVLDAGQTAREAAPECVPYGGPTECTTEIADLTSAVEVRVVFCGPT